MKDNGDKFRDAIAFARCVMRDDYEGMEIIIDGWDNPLDIFIPQAWILNAAIAKLSMELGISVDETWMLMLSSVDVLEQGENDEDSSD